MSAKCCSSIGAWCEKRKSKKYENSMVLSCSPLLPCGHHLENYTIHVVKFLKRLRLVHDPGSIRNTEPSYARECDCRRMWANESQVITSSTSSFILPFRLHPLAIMTGKPQFSSLLLGSVDGIRTIWAKEGFKGPHHHRRCEVGGR